MQQLLQELWKTRSLLVFDQYFLMYKFDSYPYFARILQEKILICVLM